jgi:nucleoid-associated protein YgaU
VGLFDRGKKRQEEEAREEALEERMKGNALMRVIIGLELPVEGLRVDYDDGIAFAYGTVTSEEVREKVLLALSAAEGVESVEDRMIVEAAPEPDVVTHTVVAGDTLSKIALAHYGDGMAYMRIFEANRDQLDDPDRIFPDQVLVIPPAE